MPLGTIILIVVLGLVYFGVFQTTLDRLKLTDRHALFIIGLIILGSFINVPISRGLSFNLGGIIPVAVGIYVISKAERNMEIYRSLTAIALTALIVYSISQLLIRVPEPGVDMLYLNGLIAGIIAYTVGRSRRAAFASGVIGLFILDIVHLIIQSVRGLPATGILAGAGAFDALVIAGITGLILAEIFGETLERITNKNNHTEFATATIDADKRNNKEITDKDGENND